MVAVARAFPKTDVRAPNSRREPCFAGPQPCAVAVALNDERCQGGSALDEFDIRLGWCSTLVEVKRERAKHRAGIVNDRRRPARPQTVRQRDVRVACPQFGSFHVLDEHHLAEGCGGTTGSLPDRNRHRTDRIDVG